MTVLTWLFKLVKHTSMLTLFSQMLHNPLMMPMKPMSFHMKHLLPYKEENKLLKATDSK